MRLRRLLGMGIPELVFRSRQEALKWLEETRLPGRTNGRPHRGVSLDRFRELGTDRFFEGAAGDETPALLAEHLPGARDQLIAAAEAVRQGRFDVLGYRGLSFGDPVDWHLDPVSGRRAPLVQWSRLDPLDPNLVGDSKIIWELNRHQWLIPLGQAYRLTRDERYSEAFAGYVREWMRANPPGLGINWASSLEVALRLVAWCWAFFLFRRSEALPPDLLMEMLDGIGTHASHVERYLSYYFSPNTHLTGEALGLFYAGVVLAEVPAAERWRTLGARILAEEIERQVLADGVYFEQSTCYQRYTIEIYLHFMILAARNGMVIPASVGERVRRMLDFLLAVRRPDGSIPQIGDADAGWLLPLAPRASDDLQGIFSTAASFFGRPEYAWAAGGPAPETLWLLGPSALKGHLKLTPAPPPTAPSRVFADGGYAVMRSGWNKHAHHLIFDAGPLGCPVSGGHGHADLLSLQCSIFGEPVLVDAGTYCYTADPGWRSFFRGTAAHSTVMVDHTGQAVPAGPFAWRLRPRARLRRWLSTEALDFADAEHDAYGRLPDPVVHRRRVLFVKPRYWMIVDDLAGTAEHRAELRFQFAPMEVTVDQALWARARTPGGHALLVRPFAAVPLTAALRQGCLDPIQGWISTTYGQRQPAPALVYAAVTRLPLRILTLLLPLEDPHAPPPAVSLIRGGDLGPLGLVFDGWRERIRLEAHDVTITQSLDLSRGEGA